MPTLFGVALECFHVSKEVKKESVGSNDTAGLNTIVKANCCCAPDSQAKSKQSNLYVKYNNLDNFVSFNKKRNFHFEVIF